MDILNINLNLLKPFWAVYKTGGINKAAKMLDMAPPAVSYSIKQLEKQLGIKLFITHKKGADPTHAATEIFPFIENMFDNLTKCNEQLNISNKGTIRIGIATTILNILFVKFVPVFKRKYPEIMLELHHHPKNDYLAMLENNQVDIAISQLSKRPKEHINVTGVANLKTTFFTTKKFAETHGLQNEITLDQFLKFPFIMLGKSGRILSSLEDTLGQKINCIAPLSSFTAYHMVMDGQGIGLHFDDFIDMQNTDQVLKLTIKDKPAPLVMVECAYHQKPSAILSLFIRELKEFYL